MRHQIAHVKNIKLLYQAGEALRTRAPGVPGIGLLWGPTGFGKTTAAAWYANQCNALYVRAVATWTPSSMLGALMRELDSQPMSRCADMVAFIVERLALENRPVFVDEADYLLSKKLLETLRDLHDLSNAPLILIGMADFRRKVIHREQLAGRIAQWVEVRAADIDDARALATACCEVEVADDLLKDLQRETRGSMRGMTVGLDRIEAVARKLGKDRMTAKDWGNREFTLPHGV